MMAVFSLSMGISSFPTSYLASSATASESAGRGGTRTFDRHNVPSPAISAPVNAEGYVRQLRSDVAKMRSVKGVLIAQARPNQFAPVRYTRTTTSVNRANNDNLSSNSGQASVPLAVPAPKTTIFKPVATVLPNDGGMNQGESSPNPGASGFTVNFAWPAAGTLTSRFGRRWGKMHKGIDIAGPVGTPINSAADGTVISAGWSSGGYGNMVEVRHADGSTTRYGHNSRTLVAAGQSVRQGQQIAEMGSTGHSTGSHLHFEIRPSGGNAVNPISHLPSNS